MIFGCACYPYLRPYNHHKLSCQTSRCIFLGYSSLHKSYQCLHSYGKVYISNHVVFDESSFSFQSEVDFSSVSNTRNPSKYNQNSSTVSTLPQIVMQLDIPLFQSPSAATIDRHSISPAPSSFSPTIDTSTSSSTPLDSSSSLTLAPHHISPLSFVYIGHPMVTRFKNRIFKPKTYIINC